MLFGVEIFFTQVEVELGAEFINADLAEIVAIKIEKHRMYQASGVVSRRQVARPDPAVNFYEAFFLGAGSVFLECFFDVINVRMGVNIFESLTDTVIIGESKSAQKRSGGHLAFAVHFYPNYVVLVGFHFYPGAAVRDYFGAVKTAAARLVGGKESARTADKLGHDDAFNTVYHESTAVGHERDITQIDFLFIGFAGALVYQLDLNAQRGFVGDILFAAVYFVKFGFIEVVIFKVQFKIAAGKISDRRNLVKQFANTLLEKPLIRGLLHLDQVRRLDSVAELRKVDALQMLEGLALIDWRHRGTKKQKIPWMKGIMLSELEVKLFGHGGEPATGQGPVRQ